MREPVVVTIPGTPDAKLSPNARCTWRAKQRPKQEIARAAFYATKEAIARYESTHPIFAVPGGAVSVKTAIHWEKGRRIHDQDNAQAMCKYIYDSVAKALGVNDKRFRHEPIEQQRDPAGVGFVVVTIQEAA